MARGQQPPHNQTICATTSWGALAPFRPCMGDRSSDFSVYHNRSVVARILTYDCRQPLAGHTQLIGPWHRPSYLWQGSKHGLVNKRLPPHFLLCETNEADPNIWYCSTLNPMRNMTHTRSIFGSIFPDPVKTWNVILMFKIFLCFFYPYFSCLEIWVTHSHL